MESRNLHFDSNGDITAIKIETLEATDLDDLMWKIDNIKDFENEYSIKCEIESFVIVDND